jgi:hypothetical protein
MKTLFNKLKKALEKDENVVFAYVFGSYVNGIPTPKSDVDVAVYFKKPPRGTEILDYAVKLSNFLNKEVDLVIFNLASPFTRFHILNTGEPLIVKDSEALAEFKRKTMIDYEEYKYMAEAFFAEQKVNREKAK